MSSDKTISYRANQLTGVDVTTPSDHTIDCNDLEPQIDTSNDANNLASQFTLVDPQFVDDSKNNPGELPDGKSFGPYELIEMIGMGGNGRVYRARHTCLNVEVAIKFIYGIDPTDKAAIGRFQREATSSARFVHPNLVRATDAGIEKDRVFLVTELVKGVDLTTLVEKHGALNLPITSAIACKCVAGLKKLAEHNTVHRDIKPSNIMLDENGEIKILDLGLACSSNTAHTFTETGQVMGSVDFIAPEQAADATNVDTSADVYSLGCTLFYLLTGKAPFHHKDTITSKLLAHIEDIADSVRSFRTDIPEDIEVMIRRMMAKSIEDRPSLEEIDMVFREFIVNGQLRELMVVTNEGKKFEFEAISYDPERSKEKDSSFSLALQTFGLIDKTTSESTGLTSYRFSMRWLLLVVPFVTMFAGALYWNMSNTTNENLTPDDVEAAPVAAVTDQNKSEAELDEFDLEEARKMLGITASTNKPKKKPKPKTTTLIPRKTTIKIPKTRKPTSSYPKPPSSSYPKPPTSNSSSGFPPPPTSGVPSFPPPGFPPPPPGGPGGRRPPRR